MPARNGVPGHCRVLQSQVPSSLWGTKGTGVPKGHQEPRSTEPLLCHQCPWDVPKSCQHQLTLVSKWDTPLCLYLGMGRGAPATALPGLSLPARRCHHPAGTACPDTPHATLGMPAWPLLMPPWECQPGHSSCHPGNAHPASWALQGSPDRGHPLSPTHPLGLNPHRSSPGGRGWQRRTHRGAHPLSRVTLCPIMEPRLPPAR